MFWGWKPIVRSDQGTCGARIMHNLGFALSQIGHRSSDAEGPHPWLVDCFASVIEAEGVSSTDIGGY